jgi:hypothetical protein
MMDCSKVTVLGDAFGCGLFRRDVVKIHMISLSKELGGSIGKQCRIIRII